MMTVEPGQQQWRSYLKLECEDLKGDCSWAVVVLKQLKNIKKTPHHKYYRQIKEIDNSFQVNKSGLMVGASNAEK